MHSAKNDVTHHGPAEPVDQALSSELLGVAICRTDRPTAAVSALMLAAGNILYEKFGATGACQLLRSIIDETEALLIAEHGKQPGEAVQ